MIGPRLGLLVLGAAAVAAYGLRGQWSQPEVAFTRPAPAAPAGIDMRPVVSTLHVAIPVELTRVARRADAAVEQRLALGLGAEPADPACAKRPQTGDCAVARIDGSVRQSAPASALLTGSTFRISVPLTIEPIARPGEANPGAADKEAAERRLQQLTIGFSYVVRSTPGGFTVARIEDPASEASGNPAALRLVRQLEGRLRQAALAVHDELQQTLARVPVAVATQRAWSALSQPIQLGLGSGAVLTANPEIAGSADLVSDGGRVAVRIPLSVRLAVGPADGVAVAAQKQLVTGVVAAGGEARIRMALPVRLDAVQQAAREELVKAGVIETRPDRFGPPVKVAVHGVRAYPATRQIAFELDATATRFEGQSFRGKAHLAGRPVLDAERGTITIADITFPPLPPRDLANPQLPANAPRLASDPFAAVLARAGRIDISRELADFVPQAMNLLQQRLGDRLNMAAKLGRQQPVGIETSRDGVWLLSDIVGELTLVYDGPHEALANAGAVDPGARARSGGGVNVPDAATAAVVSGAAATSAMAVSRLPGLSSAAASPPVGSATADAGEEARKKAVVVKPAINRPGNAASVRSSEARSNSPRAAVRKSNSGSSSNASANARRDWVPFSGN